MFLPESVSRPLAARAACPSGYTLRGDTCYASGWYYWGRWVLAAIVIIAFILLFVAWSCINNRRRRRQGLNPRYGTGWMMHGRPQYYNNNGAPPPPGQQQPQYNNGGWFGYGNKNNNQPPPPQYTASPVGNQYTGQTFNSNEGYYGHHQNDVPLQQPSGSYYPRGGENVYEPPSGPPPSKQ